MWFCVDCIGCNECIACDGLTNQSYCIENITYNQSEYKHRKQLILEDKNTFWDRYISCKQKSR
jgi:hypothetical protein